MTRTRVAHTRVPRAPVSRPNTSATGRPERPDPFADPPTVRISPTRVLPVVAGGPADDGASAVTVPQLRSVTPAGGGALGDGRVLTAGVAFGLLGSLGCWLVAVRALPPDRPADLAAAWLAPMLLWVLPGSAAVPVIARRHRRRAWASARLHLCTTAPTLAAVGLTVAVVVAALGPTEAAPGAVRAVLLPVAAAYVLVQVACAAAVLVAHPAPGVREEGP